MKTVVDDDPEKKKESCAIQKYIISYEYCNKWISYNTKDGLDKNSTFNLLPLLYLDSYGKK